MAEGSSIRAGLVSDSHSVLLHTQLRTSGSHGVGLFELSHSDEDVQFDSESLEKDHVIKVSSIFIRVALTKQHDTYTHISR